jgi:RNA polymerase sigma-70 factor (sigma-E family)
MAAFDDEFDTLYRLAYRVAYRFLGSRADAEDAAQEALARACIRWPRVDGHAEAWVSRVTANLAIDFLRRGRSQEAVPESPGRLDADVATRLDLARSLSSLPKRQREVVILRYLADLPEDAVAAQLGCSRGTVKQHASRGLAALRRQCPQEQLGEDPAGV